MLSFGKSITEYFTTECHASSSLSMQMTTGGIQTSEPPTRRISLHPVVTKPIFDTPQILNQQPAYFLPTQSTVHPCSEITQHVSLPSAQDIQACILDYVFLTIWVHGKFKLPVYVTSGKIKCAISLAWSAVKREDGKIFGVKHNPYCTSRVLERARKRSRVKKLTNDLHSSY